jgi:hypothetical protein
MRCCIRGFSILEKEKEKEKEGALALEDRGTKVFVIRVYYRYSSSPERPASPKLCFRLQLGQKKRLEKQNRNRKRERKCNR